MSSAAVAVRDAMAVRMASAPNPQGVTQPILAPQRVYRGAVPADAANALIDGTAGPAGYVILGTVDEVEDGFYAQPGSRGHQRSHGWARTQDDALRLYGWFFDLFHDVRLTIAGQTHIEGQVSLVMTAPDATSGAWQAMMDYRYATLDA